MMTLDGFVGGISLLVIVVGFFWLFDYIFDDIKKSQERKEWEEKIYRRRVEKEQELAFKEREAQLGVLSRKARRSMTNELDKLAKKAPAWDTSIRNQQLAELMASDPTNWVSDEDDNLN